MARDSLAAAKADLFAQLGSVPGVTAAFDHEPEPGEMVMPITLAVSTAGMSADFYAMRVRVYASLDQSAKTTQDLLDAIIDEIDATVSDHWGPSDWTVTPDRELVAMVAEWLVTAGREDE